MRLLDLASRLTRSATNMTRRRGLLFAATLLLVIPGCVVTPVKSPEIRSSQVGDDRKAQVRIGVTPRDAALRILGQPSYSTERNLAIGYLFAVKTGTAKGLLMGPCMPFIGSTEMYAMDDVWLEFNEDGILKCVEKQLVKKHRDDSEAAWRSFVKSVPDQIRPDQMLTGKTGPQ